MERGEEERRLRRWRGRGGRQEDGFIYLSRRSSLYFTAPPEADTKTNGLSSRSCKTSLPPPPPPPAPPACPPNGDSPSNANVKHRRGELDSFNAATSTVRCLARSSRNRKNQPSVYRAESVSDVHTYNRITLVQFAQNSSNFGLSLLPPKSTMQQRREAIGDVAAAKLRKARRRGFVNEGGGKG